MNATQHTPGPWRTAIRRGYVAVMAGPQTDTVAVADCRTDSTEYSEQVANAHLIAAAPELLHACRLVLECDEYSPDCAVSAAVNAARAAIAKATGGAP